MNQMAIATKKDGSLCICIDPRHLNRSLKREHYQLPVLDDILPDLAKAKVFSKLILTMDIGTALWMKSPVCLLHFQPHLDDTDGHNYLLAFLLVLRYSRNDFTKP